MSRPEYLFCHERTSPPDVKFIYRVVGDTEKYWKCLIDGSGGTFLVRKSNLKEHGVERQFYSITKEEVMEYRTAAKLITKIRSTNLYKLSVAQLSKIVEITGGHNETKD